MAAPPRREPRRGYPVYADMLYSDENFPEFEKRFEWLAGPLVVAIFAAIICVVLLSRATGF